MDKTDASEDDLLRLKTKLRTFQQASEALLDEDIEDRPIEYEPPLSLAPPIHYDPAVQSQLIVEAVKLLDSRDQQIASKPGTPTQEVEELILEEEVKDHEDQESVSVVEDDSQFFKGGLGKQFRESKMSARNYVKEYESRVISKRAFESAVQNTYPQLKSEKTGKSNALISTVNLTVPETNLRRHGVPQPVEHDPWRSKGSRSVRFTMKYYDEVPRNQSNSSVKLNQELGGRRSITKQDNDRNWWKWKLKQRVMENEDLLQKLAAQRKGMESTSILSASRSKTKRDQSKRRIPYPVTVPSISTSQLVVHGSPPRSRNRIKQTPAVTATREPIPNFYTPSTKLMNVLFPANEKQGSVDSTYYVEEPSSRPKLKTLKKDPYLTKLLAGNEIFKPEVMLNLNDPSVQRADLSRHRRHHKAGGVLENLRRKMSLESMESTDNGFTRDRLLGRDVKVLFERPSDVDATAAPSKLPVGGDFSREPSDGFLNLPMLLATGRFNHYNKLPSMKMVGKNQGRRGATASSQKDKVGPNKTRTIAITNIPEGMEQATLESPKPRLIRLAAAEPPPTEPENTKIWAKKIMQRLKPSTAGASPSITNPDNESAADSEDAFVLNKEDLARLFPHSQILPKLENVPLSKKYKISDEQETNLLYHEILMSKWKKLKNVKDTGDVTMGMEKGVAQNKRTKKYELQAERTGDVRQNNLHFQGDKKINDSSNKAEATNNGKPKGFDIWLENIREKAKRTNMVAPLPESENGTLSDENLMERQTAPPLMTAFEKAALKVNYDRRI